jgi:hypothetical protein
MAQDLMEMLESMRAGQASVRHLFGGEGHGLRLRGEPSADHLTKLARTAEFLAGVRSGQIAPYLLNEALSTSDFPLMFGQILDRALLANYQHTEPTYRNYVRIGSVADFRTVYRFAINGAEATLSQVGELSEYPDAAVSESRYTYQVTKYGKKVPMSWEVLINDQLGAFDDLPRRLATSARNTEELFATKLFVDASGPHASFYTNGNKNLVNSTNGAVLAGNNPPLTIAALQDAMTILSKQTDADGNPIVITAVRLVVPPALRVTAMNILHATEIHITQPGAGGVANVQRTDSSPTATGEQRLVANNWMRSAVELDVNAFIPIVASSANGTTTWFLFADARVGRPALEVGFLRGHEAPEMFMKAPNAVRLGGGAASPDDGDFDTDSVEYKVRHVLGGTRLDPKMTVASNGSGS